MFSMVRGIVSSPMVCAPRSSCPRLPARPSTPPARSPLSAPEGPPPPPRAPPAPPPPAPPAESFSLAVGPDGERPHPSLGAGAVHHVERGHRAGAVVPDHGAVGGILD